MYYSKYGLGACEYLCMYFFFIHLDQFATLNLLESNVVRRKNMKNFKTNYHFLCGTSSSWSPFLEKVPSVCTATVDVIVSLIK